MSQLTLLFVLGLATGSVYAAVGLGVAITYKGTGVVNLAQAAFGAWGAFTVDDLRRTGRLTVPVPGVRGPILVAGGLPTWPAVLLGVSLAGLLAVATYFVVFRPLRAAPQLARVVASLGVLLLLVNLIGQQFGTSARRVAPILPSRRVDLGVVTTSADRLGVAGVALAAAVVAWSWFRWTRVGLAVQASSESETDVGYAGWSPTLLGSISWASGAAATAFVFTLATPALGLSVGALPLLVVPGLAVALAGRLSSLGVTVVAGLALGGMQSQLTWLVGRHWWPQWASKGLNQVLPFLLVTVVLFASGATIPDRGERVSARLPSVPRGPVRLLPASGVVAAICIALVATSGSNRFGVITSLIIVLVALSSVVVTGLAGQPSLAQAPIAGFAGFSLSRLGGVPFPVGIVVASLASAVVGIIVGLPALRIRGAQFAIVSLAGAVAVENFILQNPALTKPTGNPIGSPSLFGLSLAVQRGASIARLQFALFVLIVVVIMAVAVATLVRGRTGRRLLAIRSDERASEAAGISVARTKLLAFGVSGFIAGIGGCLLGYSRGQLTAASFGMFVGITWFALGYVGGITSVAGAGITGFLAPLGVAYVFADNVVHLDRWYGIIAAVALVVNIVLYPDGIAIGVMRLWAGARRRSRPAPDRAQPDADEPTPTSSIVRHSAPRRDQQPALEARSVIVSYGPVTAVDQVSFSVHRGEIVSIIGPNGAGKTSLVDALTGFTKSRGSVLLAGRALDGASPNARSRAGLARTWQHAALFSELTVREHVLLGARRVNGARDLAFDLTGRRDEADLAVLDRLGITHLADAKPDTLSVGEHRLVDLARALAARPTVLLADEPAAGLDDHETRRLGQLLCSLADDGLAVVVVEHHLDLVASISDRLLVLDLGRCIADAPPAEALAHADVVTAYLGGPSKVPM